MFSADIEGAKLRDERHVVFIKVRLRPDNGREFATCYVSLFWNTEYPSAIYRSSRLIAVITHILRPVNHDNRHEILLRLQENGVAADLVNKVALFLEGIEYTFTLMTRTQTPV